MMITIKYPEPAFRVKDANGKKLIFDALRKIWIPLTREEWVRQNFVQFLVHGAQYPSTLIAQEKEIWLNDLKKRFDILVYDREHRPWLLVECKAPSVTLNQTVLEQALRYNISVPVTYIVITNGLYTHGWKKMQGRLEKLQAMPIML